MSIGIPSGGSLKAADETALQEAKLLLDGSFALGDGTYDPLLIYLREIGQTPLLNLADERKLARKARKGDPKARAWLCIVLTFSSAQAPVLHLADERKLARKARKGDPKARERLILASLRLVVHIARGYSNKGLPMADLINERDRKSTRLNSS